MNMTKSLSTLGVGAAIVTGSMLAVNLASAQSSTEQQAERVSELSERFNLDESEVRTYFEEKKTERQAEREDAPASHIAGLVEAGTLTQEQADELNAMRDAAQAEAEALKESDAEREEMQTLKEENQVKVQAWADAEGINLDDIKPEGGDKGGRGHGRGHGGGHGPRGDSESMSTEDAIES